MRIFNSVVQALVRTMIGIWRDGLYRLEVAAELVRHDDARLAKLPDQPGEEASGGLGVATWLNQNVEYITVSVDCPPEPEFLAADHNDSLIHVPLIIRLWPVPANAGGKMAAKAIDPQSNSFSADDHAALREQILHIGRAQSKSVISPNRISDDLTWKTKTLQTGKSARQFHCTSIPETHASNNLAIPFNGGIAGQADCGDVVGVSWRLRNSFGLLLRF